MNAGRTYRNQFPKSYWLPARLTAVLNFLDWHDTSWGNDEMPSFERRSWIIWCSDKAGNDRNNIMYGRYTIIADHGDPEVVFQTTDQLIAWLWSNP